MAGVLQRRRGAVALTPPRLNRALESLRRWREAGGYLVPIRHHSPGCSRALTALLHEVRPTTILIEGPREYTALLGALGDAATRPPIAVLSIADDRSAFYPLADFSPEWVALRWGTSHGADVDFIDQSWAARSDDDPGAAVRTLQAEHHLARSTAIAALASQLGCRDHDEVWEHLFELRDATQADDWRTFTAEVLAWAALARLEADREVLDADGTHAREAVMAAMLARHRATAEGPIVVVTGAFHTLALLEAMDDTPEGRWVTGRDPGPLEVERPAWLIRYDHTRLDGLRGYGAGMPAPGFWHRAWQGQPTADGGRALTIEVLLDVADRVRADGGLLSSAEVTAAGEHALQLAAVRGRAWPGRTDLTDAMLTCFVHDDTGLSGALGAAIDTVFAGTILGEVPPGVAAPPLVAEARALAQQHRFVVTDATSHRVSLDTHRSPKHRARREFLATMRFLNLGFCRQLGGPDLIAGSNLGSLFEEWDYAWTPMVEAALIEASSRGATLAELRRRAVAELLYDEAATAATVTRLLTELVLMGATAELAPVLTALRQCYDTDSSLASLTASLTRLLVLRAEAGRYSLGEADAQVAALIQAGLDAAAFQLLPLADVDADGAGAACEAIVSLHSVVRRLDARPSELSDLDAADTHAVHRELTRLREARRAPARLHGCLVALASTTGEIVQVALEAEIGAHLNVGTDPDRVAGFLLGLMQAAPDVILHNPDVLELLNARLGDFDEEAFLRILPDLRLAFTWLRPSETASVATHVATLTGASVAQLDAVLHLDPALAAKAWDVERSLVTSLRDDGLLALMGGQP